MENKWFLSYSQILIDFLKLFIKLDFVLSFANSKIEVKILENLENY